MASLVVIVFFLATLSSSAFSEQHGHEFCSRRQDYGPNYYSQQSVQVQSGGSYGYSLRISPNSNLQAEFLSLFNQQGVEQMAERCSPRVIQDLSSLRHLCSRNDFFYAMNPSHIDAVQSVTRLINSASTPEGNICIASQLRNSPDVNPSVWMKSIMGIALNNPELSSLHLPSLVEVYPSMVVHSAVMAEAKRLAEMPSNTRAVGCVVLDGSFGTRNGPENLLWYWREDVMLNSHHWYWHLSNPFLPMAMNGQPPPPRPDRHGELFNYMHSSFLARYHSERLSNGLRKVVPLTLDYGTSLGEPYYANLDASNSGRRWSDRPPNTRVQDVLTLNRVAFAPMNISVAQRNLEVNRILESIASGRLITSNNEVILLNNRNGVDFLGDVVEATIYSVNPGYYGAYGIHNSGHILLGLAHDPDGRRRQPPGVISDPATAMRDPIFYRYHLPIAQIFDSHKHYLPPYHPTEGEFPLVWPGVTIEGVQVLPLSQRPNELTTYWSDATFDISRGIDFNRSAAQGQRPIDVCVRHLDHEQFEYQISIKRDPSVRSDTASIRIFLAPSFDEDGRRYTFFDQRTLFFAMDYFTVRLQPGDNFVRRPSVDSSLTIPWPQRLEELEHTNQNETPDCGCGFPQHLLIPKGKREGMTFDLFVMATNADEDAVPIQPPQPGAPNRPPSCIPAPIYCGVPGQLYPDTKPMGFPFDRLPYFVHDTTSDGRGGYDYTGSLRRVNSIEEYTAGLPNAALVQVRITHIGA